MSRRAVYLLQKVENEYISALAAIAFTNRFWHYQDRVTVTDAAPLQHLKKVSLQQFNAALPEETVESIFITRLFAVFEGILKDCHNQFHNADAAPNYASVSWYIDRVAFFNRGRISEKLTAKVHEVRKHRNSLVHSLSSATKIVFADALSDLSKFAIKLPDI